MKSKSGYEISGPHSRIVRVVVFWDATIRSLMDRCCQHRRETCYSVIKGED
jgi:hypothetical protein